MKLPSPPPEYNQRDQAELRRAIEFEDGRNVKMLTGIVLVAPNGTKYKVTVGNTGTLSTTQVN